MKRTALYMWLFSAAWAGGITQKLQVSPPLSGIGTVPNPLACASCALVGGTPGYAANGLISGGGVAWTGNLDFTVSAAVYQINSTTYSSPQVNLTLAAAHATLNRIDLIIVDTSGVASVLTGTPAASPSAPTVDPATQLALTFVSVPATATVPANVTTLLLYDENVGAATEWNTSVTANFNAGSTNNPYHLTKDTEATTAATGNNLQLQKGAGTIAPLSYNSLVFYIRSKASWGNNRSLNIYFANAGTQVGNSVLLANGAFGFTSGQTSTYQQIVVPISLFNFNVQGSPVNQLVFKVAGTGGTLGFYLDWIQLQTGITQQPGGSYLNWKGPFDATVSYSVNDVVTSNGVSWVAALANVASTPTTSNTNWSAMTTPALHSVSLAIDGGGSAISTGDVDFFPPVDFSCTINRVDITGSPSGSITIDVWKAAGAIPTSGNKISASAPITLSASQINLAGSLSGWTTAVAAGDVFGFTIVTASTVTKVTAVIWCQ